MNKTQYAEFHKYLAMLIYEYNKMRYDPYLTEEFKTELEEILEALEKVMKICLLKSPESFAVDKENKWQSIGRNLMECMTKI